MVNVSLKQLQDLSINTLIDENYRFTIIPDEDMNEEEETDNVIHKITLLREQCYSGRD